MTIKTNWETMQSKRLALSCAKDAKAAYARELKQLHLAGEYLRSLRYWVQVASNGKTLKARKLALTEHLARLADMPLYSAAIACCQDQIVGDSCRTNIRNAISWAQTASTAPTFKDWQVCVDHTESCIADALCQLDVVHSKVKASWSAAKASIVGARKVIGYCAKDILAPSALTKAQKYEIKRRYYALSGVMTTNSYQLVSASAAITQRQEGTTLNTANWLKLVRTTRRNYTMRGAHQLNNRQDYLVRLPVYNNGTIDGRNWFVGSI